MTIEMTTNTHSRTCVQNQNGDKSRSVRSVLLISSIARVKSALASEVSLASWLIARAARASSRDSRSL